VKRAWPLLVWACLVVAACSSTAKPPDPKGCDLPLCPPVSRQVDLRLGGGTSDVGLFVEPNDGATEIVKGIDAAQDSIFVSAYILSDHRIVRALQRAAAQGVDVYVLLEHHPYGIVQQPEVMFSELAAADVRVRWAPPYFEYSHAKFMILDDQALILSSANFSQSGFTSDRDFVVVDDDPLDVREADNIFRADWDEITPVLNDPDLLVSPVNARGKFYQLIGLARQRLDLYSEEVLDGGMVNRLADEARRGVRVRILAATISSQARTSLTKAGVLIGPASPGGLYIHAKAMVVDGRLGFVGSENFSSTSLDQNRELGVIIQQQAAVNLLEATFQHDWNAGRG